MKAEKALTDLADATHKQAEIAREAIKEAQGLDELIAMAGDQPGLKEKLAERKAGMLKVARDLVANTTATSSSVESTFKIISDLSKKT